MWRRLRLSLFPMLLVVLCATGLHAEPLTVSVSGVWGASAPVSTWTAPNAPWAFSFVVDSNPSVTFSSPTGFGPAYSDFAYELNGNPVATTPQVIAFHTNQTLGVSFGPTTGFQLFGPQAFSGPTSSPEILPGTYIASGQSLTVEPYFEVDQALVQFLTGTPIVIAAAAVPAASTLLLATCGVPILLAVARHRSRSRAGARESRAPETRPAGAR